MAHPVVKESGALAEFVGTVVDTTECKRAEKTLQKAQAEFAHVTRGLTLVELTASIAHEVNQPLGAIVTNGQACLRLLVTRPHQTWMKPGKPSMYDQRRNCARAK